MITEQQRTARRQFVGSSDAAAILGLDPYRSAADVYLDKTGQVEAFAGNEATARGVRLEPVLLDYAESELGREIARDVMRVHANELLCTNFDGLIYDDEGMPAESVEAKSTVNSDEWGEPGSDEVPHRVIVQAHMGFACLPSLRVCHVPVLMPGYKTLDFRLYRISRDEEIVRIVETECSKFMTHHVRLGIPPDDFRPSIEVLKRIRREPGKAIEVRRDTFERWVVLNAAESQAKKDAEAAKAALLAEMRDGDGCLVDGQLVATFLPQTKKEHVVKECTYRVLRRKKAKGEPR